MMDDLAMFIELGIQPSEVERMACEDLEGLAYAFVRRGEKK